MKIREEVVVSDLGQTHEDVVLLGKARHQREDDVAKVSRTDFVVLSKPVVQGHQVTRLSR